MARKKNAVKNGAKTKTQTAGAGTSRGRNAVENRDQAPKSSQNGLNGACRNVKFAANANSTAGASEHIDGRANGIPANSTGKGMHKSPSANTLNRIERQTFVLWQRPFRTLQYFVMELGCLGCEFACSMLNFRRLIPTILLLGSVLSFYFIPGQHSKYVKLLEKQLFWCLYWVGLGVLSSVGLGTGLHTFLLYLGPHIARVTLAAFECNSLDFPEPPYPDDVTCPTSPVFSLNSAVTLAAIISKVRLESFMWGAGTAFGELPPYFMARAARISGQEPDDEEYKEFLTFVEGDIPKQQMSLMDKLKLWMERVVSRVGFFGILLFASIPNPFFDLAGITCGHFLIPFWTFFGATLIGKALIKMHVQMLFVVLTFSEHHVDHMVALLKTIPRIGPILQAPLKEFLQAQKLRLHRQPGDPLPEQASSLLQQMMSYVVSGMILWFLISLVNSLAQRYHKRKWDNGKRKML